MSNNNSNNNSSADPDPNDGYAASNSGTNGGTITISGTGTLGGNYTINSGTWSGYIPNNWIYIGPISTEPVKESKKKDDRDGCDCKKCKEFYPYAEPNQDDGTLICYRCRHGW